MGPVLICLEYHNIRNAAKSRGNVREFRNVWGVVTLETVIKPLPAMDGPRQLS